jgi:BirA family biotin operon repressor/biotin-[acetyl-CoA-carboxylase] ligase
MRRLVPAAPEPLALLGLILQALEPRLVDLADPDGRRRLTSEYRRRCDTVGKTVRVSLPGEVFSGTATEITPQGHLVVDVGSGSRTVAAGDVVHLRDPG